MIAVSSFAPLSRSVEVAQNQLDAKVTWEKVFDAVVYVAPKEEPALASKKTRFVTITTEFPRIKDLIGVCAESPGWSCLINADIQVSGRMKHLDEELNHRKAKCAFSLRWQFPENKIMDNGLDFFAAQQAVWKQAFDAIPETFLIGHCMWDTWMLAFFMHKYPSDTWDISNTRSVYHRQHGGRYQPHQSQIPWPKDGIMESLIWPYRKLQ